MTAVSVAPHRPEASRVVAAGVVALVGAALLVGESSFRVGEAVVAAVTLHLTGVGSSLALGSSVYFVHGDRWIGYNVATGCSAALLIAPFFFLTAALLLVRRFQIRRTIVALLAISVFIALVNQCRLLVIGTSMRIWGFETGYNRSHVLAGGVLSTIGVTLGLVMLLTYSLRERTGS